MYRLSSLYYGHLIGLKIEVEVSHVGHLHLVHHVGEVGLGEAFHLHHRLPGCQDVTNNSRFSCYVLLALSWNTTNKNPSTD